MQIKEYFFGLLSIADFSNSVLKKIPLAILALICGFITLLVPVPK